MSRPVLLDLFCGAGGAARGYADAGFEVVGVDIHPQPHYPYEFIQADVFDYMPYFGGLCDAVHASPPCQAYTRARVIRRNGHPDLIDATRAALVQTGRPWVIENVEGAPLRDPVTLCGTGFALRVDCRDGAKRELRRHRLFESSVPLVGSACDHQYPAIPVYGHHGPRKTPGRGNSYGAPVAERRAAMGIDWMNRDELAEAIPPAFTRHVGEQLLAHLAAGVR